MILGVILAGGRGSRLGGGDKGRHSVGGRPILERVIARLGPQVDALVLNANGDPARFADLALPVLPDDAPDLPGPLAGILAGLDRAAAIGAAGIVTAPCDAPFLPHDLAARLGAAAGDGGFALAADAGGRRHPTFGLWPTRLRAPLRADLAAGARRVGDWMVAHGAVLARFPGSEAEFFNVNAPEDLARAEVLAREVEAPPGGSRA